MPVTPQLVRFGLFELDLTTSELCKNGRKLKLQEQPAHLLSLLLEKPGEVVTRDKLKEALWSADTFVDFDHSLNAAIAKLRQALGDSAENPRFIETLARRGYRFIAPVEFVANPIGDAIQGPSTNSLAAIMPVFPGEKKLAPLIPTARRLLLVSIMGGLALAAFALWLRHKEERSETELVKLTEDTGLTTDPAVSSDGKLLAYASDRGSSGNLNLWIQQLVPGGNAVQLTHDNMDASEPAFSPDGSRIVFHSQENGGLCIISSLGGEVLRLTRAGRNPHFSPDGRWIAYWVDAPGTLYVIPAEGGDPRRVGSDLHAASNPVWSPDNKHLLAYVPPPRGFVWSEADWWLVSLSGEPSKRTGAFSELKRQGFSLGFDRIPRLSQWTEHFITFAGAFGDAMNSWRAPISDNGRITGRAERLTSGTMLEVSPTLSPNSELIFASMNRNAAVWSIPADTDHAKVAGEMKKITAGFAELMPSVSSDGKEIAFTTAHKKIHPGTGLPNEYSDEAAQLQVRIKDLRTGKESVVSNDTDVQWHPQISRDGSMVAYTSSKPGPVLAARVNGGSPRVIVGGKNFFVWDWSLDNKRLLVNMSYQDVGSVDLLSGSKKLFFNRPGFELFQVKFSPDYQFVAVLGCQENDPAVRGCQIFLAPLDGGVPVSADSWITFSHPSQWDDKPRWSPSGKLIYFISDRDGYFCLWAQSFSSSTKRLTGAPFPIYHFHNARLSIANVGPSMMEMGIAKDKIVMGLGELTGNIWSLKRK